MDDWTDPYPNSDDLDLLLSQPVLLDEVWGAVEDRLRVARAGAAAQAEAPEWGRTSSNPRSGTASTTVGTPCMSRSRSRRRPASR